MISTILRVAIASLKIDSIPSRVEDARQVVQDVLH
jgi:hypothetical protein